MDLLKKLENIEKIDENELNSIFEAINEQNVIEQAKIIDFLAKKLKIGKVELKKLYSAFLRKKTQENRNNAFKTILRRFNELIEVNNIELPFGYYIADDGYLAYENDKSFFLLTRFFFPYEKIIAKDRAFFKFADIRGQKYVASGRDIIKADKLANFFADRGEIFDNKKANLVVGYISEFLRINEYVIKITKGVVETGWQEDGNFCLPQLYKNVKWLDNLPHSNIIPRFKTKGDVQKQKELLKELSKGKIFIVILFALSTTLVKLIDNVKLNYICHIGGLTGEGKSFAVKTAISLFGEPDVSIYGKNWNATVNGLETYWETMKDVPAWVDELENTKNLNDVIQACYSFSEGTGRTRAYTKDGEVLNREIKTFRGGMFTTGEKGFDEIINNTAGRNKPLGLNRRVLDLNVRELWKGVDKRKVGNIIDKNFGLFVIEWIRYVSNSKKLINEIYDYYADELKDIEISGKEKLYYLLLTTLAILQNMEIINEEEYSRQYNNIIQIAREDMYKFDEIKNIAKSFISFLQDFIIKNKNKFLGIGDDENVREVFGLVENKRVYLLKSVFDEMCIAKGFVKKQVLEDLKKKNRLEYNAGRVDLWSPKKLSNALGGARMRVYCIVTETLEEE